MEYGMLGLLPWLCCFFWLLWSGIRVLPQLFRELKKKKADPQLISQLFVLLAFGIGLFGLALEGLVLHSFVDRMIIYPLMLLFGLAYGKYEDLNKQKSA